MKDAAPVTSDPVYEVVRAAVVEAFGCEPDEVQPSTRLFIDFGEESLEWLVFRFDIEKQLGLSNPFEPLQMNGWKCDSNGCLTSDAQTWWTAELTMLGLPAPDFRQAKSWKDLVTIEFLVGMVRQAIDERDRMALEQPADETVAKIERGWKSLFDWIRWKA